MHLNHSSIRNKVLGGRVREVCFLGSLF